MNLLYSEKIFVDLCKSMLTKYFTVYKERSLQIYIQVSRKRRTGFLHCLDPRSGYNSQKWVQQTAVAGLANSATTEQHGAGEANKTGRNVHPLLNTPLTYTLHSHC